MIFIHKLFQPTFSSYSLLSYHFVRTLSIIFRWTDLFPFLDEVHHRIVLFSSFLLIWRYSSLFCFCIRFKPLMLTMLHPVASVLDVLFKVLSRLFSVSVLRLSWYYFFFFFTLLHLTILSCNPGVKVVIVFLLYTNSVIPLCVYIIHSRF